MDGELERFGGGVVQLLRTLLPYSRGAGIEVRWMVLRGSAEFFRVTKRVDNHLQGQVGEADVLGIDELTTLDRAAEYHAQALASLLAPGDVVVLHEPPDGSHVGAAGAGGRTSHGLAAGVLTATQSDESMGGLTTGLAARPTVPDSDGAPDYSRDPVVVSLARWDRIKDPLGILDGFLERM